MSDICCFLFLTVSIPYESDPRSERLCVIINNKTFEGKGFRHGSDQDAEGLKRLFKGYLGFVVDYHEDKSAKEIKDLMRQIKDRRNISRCSCLVVIILSHGHDEEILGTDNKTVSLKAITKCLNGKKCPPLKGKPKVFIVQACRGNHENDVNCDAEASCDTVSLVVDSSYTGGVNGIDGADMLIAFATIPDHVAYRNTTNGSPFIQKFIEIMRKKAHDTHLGDIFTRVNNAVASKGVQMPSIVSQLRGHLYLRPK